MYYWRQFSSDSQYIENTLDTSRSTDIPSPQIIPLKLGGRNRNIYALLTSFIPSKLNKKTPPASQNHPINDYSSYFDLCLQLATWWIIILIDQTKISSYSKYQSLFEVDYVTVDTIIIVWLVFIVYSTLFVQ